MVTIFSTRLLAFARIWLCAVLVSRFLELAATEPTVFFMLSMFNMFTMFTMFTMLRFLFLFLCHPWFYSLISLLYSIQLQVPLTLPCYDFLKICSFEFSRGDGRFVRTELPFSPQLSTLWLLPNPPSYVYFNTDSVLLLGFYFSLILSYLLRSIPITVAHVLP